MMYLSREVSRVRGPMEPISVSDFSVSKVGFQAPKKLEQGGVVGITYDGAPLHLKIPGTRVPFDCGKGFQDKGRKLELKIEIPPEFDMIRNVLTEIDQAARNHIRESATEICRIIGIKNDLRFGESFHGLLRPASGPKYPDKNPDDENPDDEVGSAGPDEGQDRGSNC